MNSTRPRRLKRILAAFVVVLVLTSPVLWMMPDGAPKIIAGGIWFVILGLTAAGVFFIGLATSNDRR